MDQSLEELRRALSEALGGIPVTEERGTKTVTFVCATGPREPSVAIYVERMADGYQLTQSPTLPDQVNRAITEVNQRAGTPITRPERDDTQPPLTTAPRPAEEATDRPSSDRRPPGPSLAGIGGSWD